MRTLPDSPSLSHLRHQAKDLLAGLRGTDPTAALADAQTSLAEQYGFAGWTDMKAEVDRRQGLAAFADPVLAATRSRTRSTSATLSRCGRSPGPTRWADRGRCAPARAGGWCAASRTGGAVTSLANYAHGQIQVALDATEPEDQLFLERSVRHVLAHLPTVSTLEQFCAVAVRA